ncbi:hypothetical protein B0H17DRAFT_1181495 [Mycena rosella]|uniref:Uncharacterized protein n=1 Tax=Mycena rosella TaxID=1033263 RepID=A0AAD7D8M1_MYCRO|nr:hypothetical protein B0H17DRAFT_1181495 [Mycena rosella]
MRLPSCALLLLPGATADPGAGLYPPGLQPLIARANVLLATGQFCEAAKAYSEAIGIILWAHWADCTLPRLGAGHVVCELPPAIFGCGVCRCFGLHSGVERGVSRSPTTARYARPRIYLVCAACPRPEGLLADADVQKLPPARLVLGQRGTSYTTVSAVAAGDFAAVSYPLINPPPTTSPSTSAPTPTSRSGGDFAGARGALGLYAPSSALLHSSSSSGGGAAGRAAVDRDPCAARGYAQCERAEPAGRVRAGGGGLGTWRARWGYEVCFYSLPFGRMCTSIMAVRLLRLDSGEAAHRERGAVGTVAVPVCGTIEGGDAKRWRERPRCHPREGDLSLVVGGRTRVVVAG